MMTASGVRCVFAISVLVAAFVLMPPAPAAALGQALDRQIDAPEPVTVPAEENPAPADTAPAPETGAPPELPAALADDPAAGPMPTPEPAVDAPPVDPAAPSILPPSLVVSDDILTDTTGDSVDPLAADQKQMISEVDREVEEMLKGREFIPSTARTLLFTPFQRGLLDKLRAELKRNPPPKVDPAAPTASTDGLQEVIKDPEDLTPEQKRTSLREISLGGIMFRSEKEWVIWFNNQRVTPGTLIESVIDLKVYRSYIELRWLDTKSNKIYPIRLKPNQRFNFDQNVFLPG